MIPEIRLHICNKIYELHQPCKTLAAMAQSCRTFEEPALSILWCTQTSLMPIMGRLPDDLLEESEAKITVNSVDDLTRRRWSFHFPCPPEAATGPMWFQLLLGVDALHQCISPFRPWHSCEHCREHSMASSLQVICERLSDAPLPSFNFSIYKAAFGIDSPEPTADDIRPLHIFPDVTTFTFKSDTLFKLDDRSIQEIATAWPNLTTLKLHGPITGFSQVTVAGLAFLARKCQNLSTLHLQIEGRIVSSPLDDKACGLRPNVRMESISLGCSPIEDMAQVATVLARALPNLCCVEVEDVWTIRMSWGDRILFSLFFANRWERVEALG
jgi:hypothetical protein